MPDSPIPQLRMNWTEDVIRWHLLNGRYGLPWQTVDRHRKLANPYSVWVSEVMLQQTQVAKVIDYYDRFMGSFPDVQALAAAELDSVLAHWSGLGYYRRAHYLHATAVTLVQKFGGVIPREAQELVQLKGIGRSTAGAIRSLGFGIGAAILDANVARVLSRFWATEGTKSLWSLAESLIITSSEQKELAKVFDCEPYVIPALYTQGMMDLGAIVCGSKEPLCSLCPLNGNCQYHKSSAEHENQGSGSEVGGEANLKGQGRKRQRGVKPKRPAKKVLKITWVWLYVCGVDAKRELLVLQKRPVNDIWPGLFSPIQLGEGEELSEYLHREFGLTLGGAKVMSQTQMPQMRWELTHRKVQIDCIQVEIKLTGEERRNFEVSSGVEVAEPVAVGDMASEVNDSGLGYGSAAAAAHQYKLVGLGRTALGTDYSQVLKVGMPSPFRDWVKKQAGKS